MDVLMHGFGIKDSKDLKKGDKILGAVGQTLTVADCALHQGPRYLLKYYEGECEVGAEQLLSLLVIKETKDILDREFKAHDVCVISVRDFLRSSDDFKESVVVWRGAWDCKEIDVSIEPYIMGILMSYEDFAQKLRDKGSGLLDKVGYRYLMNSREVRLELLAGILELYGNVSPKEFSYCTRREVYAEQVALLARSLGFVVKIEKEVSLGEDVYTVHGMCGSADKGRITEIPFTYHELDYDEYPSYIDVGSFEIIPLDDGEYVTFTVDGDKKQFLRSDLTVGYAGVAEEF